MKKGLFVALARYLAVFSAAVSFVACSSDSSANAERDDFDASKVCPESGTNAYGISNRGTFVDERDGQVYKYTTIGNQVWMAENSRYRLPADTAIVDNPDPLTWKYPSLAESQSKAISGVSKTCETTQDSCDALGSMYNCVGAYYYACPNGWHLPTRSDFVTLVASVGGANQAIMRLRSTSGWLELNRGEDFNGTDDCGFSILPTQENRDYAYYWYVASEHVGILAITSVLVMKFDYYDLPSCNAPTTYVRCLKD